MMSVSGISYGKKALSIQPEESNGKKKSYSEKSMNFNLEDKNEEKEKLPRSTFQVTMGRSSSSLKLFRQSLRAISSRSWEGILYGVR